MNKEEDFNSLKHTILAIEKSLLEIKSRTGPQFRKLIKINEADPLITKTYHLISHKCDEIGSMIKPELTAHLKTIQRVSTMEDLQEFINKLRNI
jgi:hypothetical protein